MKKRSRLGTKKRRLKIGRILLVLIILILLGVGIYYGISRIINSDMPLLGEKIAKEQDEEKTYSLSMIMVGDNLIHSSIYNEANRNANYNGYDFTPMYSHIKEIVQNYDLAYYNQETILGGSGIGVSDYPRFNSPYEVGDAMLDAGFNLVSLATNHTIDRGETAVKNSCDYWSNKEGVLTAGSYCSEEEKNEIKVMEINNITYTMLNYTYGTNGIPVFNDKEYLVNVWPTSSSAEYEAYKETVRQDIEKVRDKVDVLIVAMHWGVEYTHNPTNYQKDAAQFLADLGVDIVIGTHPHVIQPVTWIDDTLIVYSLGNLISAQYQDDNYNKMVGLMSSLDITKTVKGDDINIKIDNINNELIYTYYNGYRNFKVIPFSIITSDYLSNYKSVYETYKAVVQMYDNTMTVANIN